MRIAHFSDCHVELRQPEIRRALEFIADDATANHVDLLVDAGDWYDGATRAGERNESTDLQQRLRAAAPLLAVMGNHGDPRDLGPQFTEIDARRPVHVAHKPELVYFRRLAGISRFLDLGEELPGDLLILCLPWLRKAALVDPATLADGEDLGAAALAKLRAILDGWRQVLAAHEGPALLVAHADVQGRVRSAGEPPETGEELVVPAAWLRDLDPRGRLYAALGHEHDAQAFADHVRYSGTPAPTTYGEAKPKSYCLVDLAADRAPVVEERRTPVAPLVRLEATWEDGAWVWDGEGTQPVTAGAKVRLRYHFLDHERAAARSSAAEWARSLRDDSGAIEVLLDPKQRQILRRRTEEGAMARARSTTDKLRLWYQHVEREEGQVVPALQKDRLAVLLAEVEREAGVAPVTAPGVAVAFEAIRVRGIGPFRELAELRLDALAGRLVAFVGPNGAGKSTFLGMAFALLYREHPDGWQLVDRAHGTAALIEGDVRVGGERWTLRLKVNGNSRKMEAYVLDAGGRLADPSMERGGTTPYDRWIAARFPSREVARATLFASQKGAGDLLDAQPGARRAALVQMLGQGHLQTLAARVRDRLQPPKDRGGDARKGLRELAEGVRGALSQQEVVEATREEREREAEERQADVQAAWQLLGAERELVAAARERLAGWEARRADIVARGEGAKAVCDGATKAAAAARKAVEEQELVVAAADKAVAARQAELQAAQEASAEAAKLGALEEALAAAVAQEGEARGTLEAAQLAERQAREAETQAGAAFTVAAGELRAAEGAVAVARQDVGRAEAALAAAQQGAARLAEVQDAVAALPAAEERLAEAKRAQQEVTDAIGRSERWDVERAAALASAVRTARDAAAEEQRGKTARDRVAGVPCGGPDAQPTCEFLRDAAAVDLHALVAGAAAAREAVDQLAAQPWPDWYIEPAARRDLRDDATFQANDTSRVRARIAEVAALLPEIEKRAAEVDAAQARFDEARAALAAAEERHAAALQACATAKAAYEAETGQSKFCAHRRCDATLAAQGASAARAAAEKARDDARKAVERAGAIDVLRDRVADATAAARAASDSLAVLRAEHGERMAAEKSAAAARAAIVEEYRAIGEAPVVDESAVHAAQQRHTEATAAAATAEQALATVREAAAKAAALRADLVLAEQREQDHELLLRALDKTGIQALEIDAAAPEISELVNRMLEGGLGERMEFALDTKERGADGREREGLPFLVYDNSREGVAREAREVLSGGEGVMVAWALRLAVAIYANQMAGVSGGDLFGDEPGAGLRGQNARIFIGLLRKAIDLGEFDRLCWIPEEGAPLELADVRVVVDQGRVAVEGREGATGPAPLALEAVA